MRLFKQKGTMRSQAELGNEEISGIRNEEIIEIIETG